jgi:hypothetical protein
MKMDNLQEIWQSESQMNQPKLNQLSASEKFQNPIQKIKRNMIYEFIGSMIGFVFTLTIMRKYDSFLSDNMSMYYTVFAVEVILSLLFFIQFYQFYKTINKPQFSTLKSLIAFRYELKIALHIYRIYCYLFSMIAIPFVVSILIQICQISFELENLNIGKWLLVNAPIAILGSFFFTLLVTELYMYASYGLYIKRVDNILEDLEDKDGEQVELFSDSMS